MRHNNFREPLPQSLFHCAGEGTTLLLNRPETACIRGFLLRTRMPVALCVHEACPMHVRKTLHARAE